jgi:hypothetical protein
VIFTFVFFFIMAFSVFHAPGVYLGTWPAYSLSNSFTSCYDSHIEQVQASLKPDSIICHKV